MVVDLADANAAVGVDTDKIEFWDRSVFQELSVAPRDLKTELSRTKSLTAFNDVINRHFSPERVNPAVRWFREIVAEKTAVGHDDMALSREFLEVVNLNYRIAWSQFPCPWLFRSMDEAGFFLTRKFGFLVDRRVQDVNVKQVLADASRIAGLYEVTDGIVAFGWNLGVLVVRAPKTEERPEDRIKAANLWLGALCIVLGIRAGLGWWVSGTFSIAKEFIDQIAYIALGAVLAEVAQWWIAKRDRKGD